MSDENQPNEVMESQSEPEVMPAEPAPAEPVSAESADDASEPRQDSSVVPGVDRESRDAPVAPDVPTPVTEPPAADDAAVSAEAAPVEQPASEVAPKNEHLAKPSSVHNEAATVAGVDADEAEAASSVVSIDELNSATSADEPSKMGSVVADLKALAAGRGWVIVAAVAALVLTFLFIPPISLAEKIGGGGYTALDAEMTSLSHPDGLTVNRAPDAGGRLRIKLGSVPRADFVAQDVDETLVSAVQSLPDHLMPKSPYYTIEVKSREGAAGEVVVVVPNEAEPWETLDLYAWDGESWNWLPATLDRNEEVLVASVESLPASVIVMQSAMEDQSVAVEVDAWPVEDTDLVMDEVDLSGLLIGTMGGTTGNADDMPTAADAGEITLVPVVRNWIPDREPNALLLSDMLRNEADRTAHVTNLLDIVRSRGYRGLVVDYRAVPAEDSDLYATFVRDLSNAFDDAGFWVAVVVDTPQRTDDGDWATGGYDWAALGAAVDQLRVVMPLAIEAYEPGGEAEQLIEWAVSRVDRHKLMPVYTTLSTDGDRLVAFNSILDSVGGIKVTQTLTESVTPGSNLNFTLGDVGQVETDPATESTRITTDGTVYWLGTPQWLRARMDLASRYRLGGVVLRDLFDEGNLEGLVAAVADYKADADAGAYEMPDVVWEVAHSEGKSVEAESQLARPQFAWTAPTVTGTYRIAATVGGLNKGTIEVLVQEPAPVVTETLTEGEDEEAEGTTIDPDEEEEPELRAAYVADVNVPDNTRFEKGEAFTKTWRLRNAGDTDWPEETVFVFSDGAELGEVTEVEVGAVESGENVDISVDMVAPDDDGSYKSFWALQVDDETISGGEVYVLILVGEPATEEPDEAPDDPAAEAAPEAPAAPQQPVAPVAAGSFELGGHIRDAGFPYKDLMRQAGMNWAKVQVHFGEDPAWLINASHAAGFKLQLSAIGGPDMVVQPGFEDKYAGWVAGMAAAGADAIEVWNEPNIEREWKIGHISPQAYTNLLCKAYNAIKAANPGTAVISAAPAPTGYFGGCGPNGCDDAPWMQGLYNAGAANCMDYIGAHHNSGATSPSARSGHPTGSTHHSWYFLPQTELYYNTFRGTRQVFYTEMGYASQEGVPGFSDMFAWARGTNNAQQAAWLAEAVRLSVNTGMVRCIIVWNIDFVRYGYDPQDGFAIIRPGGGCPACEILQATLGSR